jgi:hypothetical protein
MEEDSLADALSLAVSLSSIGSNGKQAIPSGDSSPSKDPSLGVDAVEEAVEADLFFALFRVL